MEQDGRDRREAGRGQGPESVAFAQEFCFCYPNYWGFGEREGLAFGRQKDNGIGCGLQDLMVFTWAQGGGQAPGGKEVTVG